MRQLVSDFAVLLAIVLMTLADLLYGLPTPKLDVPSSITVCLTAVLPFLGIEC